ncbi:hypothetical protein [Desulfobaculum bizertense]|nr:hypothetical protein [Desulfobaculum bizertense]
MRLFEIYSYDLTLHAVLIASTAKAVDTFHPRQMPLHLGHNPKKR